MIGRDHFEGALAGAPARRRARRLAHACGHVVAVVASLCTLAPLAQAQGTPPACDCRAPLFPARWSVFASTGGALLQADRINALLTASGYASVSDDAIAFGGGGFGSFGPLRLGAEHVRLDAGEESNTVGLQARLEASYTTLTVGWDLRPRGRLSIAPTLGVGRGSYVLTVGDVNGGTPPPTSPAPTFADVVASPGRDSRLSGAHWIYEPMLAADLLVVRSATQRRGITLGARLGYRIAPNRPDWEFRGTSVSAGPVDQAKGPIVRLTLGIGGR